ncbi:type VI secretion system tube protein TssD [Saccharicrinis fermentans]|uniref:Uncharacterized protein n=1 Tax=Saccharicrinis fermentans DSM 9555 = JCM 21142 TaxID=869213 RepID=W7YCB8_9BACT|nr:type VI secretion system tube protein TssD [Saccharicrinis fermentans]GAF05108.1 hypothetical protein JCM21142_93832 [Saccharicrinis fermentans DSM 9555 = JCM 21142]
MYKIKLVVNSYERWLTGLHYEYFCPIEVDKKYYLKFLQKNFPYEMSDAYDLHPYGHILPSVKKSRLDDQLQRDTMRQVESGFYGPPFVFNDLCLGQFNESDTKKVGYYNTLAKARHDAGLDYGIVPNYTHNYDKYLRPVQNMTARTSYNKIGGIFSLELDSSENDDYLYEWLLSNQMRQGKLVFYDGDGDQAFKIEFWDCFCIRIGEQMTSTSSTAMKMNVRLSPAITRNRNEEHQKVWKITDITPSSNAFGSGPVGEEIVEEGKVISCKFIDEDGNDISNPKKNQNITLVINTTGLVGKRISINLGDDKIDYEYEGTYLENDLLENISVSDDIIKLPLKTLKQRK